MTRLPMGAEPLEPTPKRFWIRFGSLLRLSTAAFELPCVAPAARCAAARLQPSYPAASSAFWISEPALDRCLKKKSWKKKQRLACFFWNDTRAQSAAKPAFSLSWMNCTASGRTQYAWVWYTASLFLTPLMPHGPCLGNRLANPSAGAPPRCKSDHAGKYRSNASTAMPNLSYRGSVGMEGKDAQTTHAQAMLGHPSTKTCPQEKNRL